MSGQYPYNPNGIIESFFWDGSGTLVQYTFLKASSTAGKVTPNASSAAVSIGVCLNTVDSTYAASIPLDMGLQGVFPCRVGSAGITQFKLVKLDATGNVVDATPTHDSEIIIGRALETGTSGQIKRVKVF